MSIFSMVFASMHLSTRTQSRRSSSGTFCDVLGRLDAVPGADVRLVCILDVHGHSCSCDRTASCSFQRDNRALARGSGWQAGPTRSKTVYMAIARIGGRWQRHGNVMAPMRIADCLQDTARLQEPCHGENFPLAWWNARRNRVLQVADGWKAAHRDCAAKKRRLRHVWGGRKRP